MLKNVNLPYYEQTKNYPKIKINFIFSLQVYFLTRYGSHL